MFFSVKCTQWASLEVHTLYAYQYFSTTEASNEVSALKLSSLIIVYFRVKNNYYSKSIVHLNYFCLLQNIANAIYLVS